ncbi:MAG: hypothetical protein IAE79_23285 [Anaerolinea sp.]|nr:hypothetical protein [Anaerolinea sp.]
MKIRKHLSAAGMIRQMRQKFGKIKEHRPMNAGIPLDDALIGAYAMFSLKDPSLLAFDQRRAEPENLCNVRPFPPHAAPTPSPLPPPPPTPAPNHTQTHRHNRRQNGEMRW